MDAGDGAAEANFTVLYLLAENYFFEDVLESVFGVPSTAPLSPQIVKSEWALWLTHWRRGILSNYHGRLVTQIAI